MALESGPTTLPTKLSIASCIETLTQLNDLCKKQMAHHQKNLGTFKTTFGIGDFREIEQRYPDPDGLIEPLARSAHYYNLTIQGPIQVLKFGTEELLKHFALQSSEDMDHRLASIQQSTLLLAQTKLNADKLLLDFLKKTPQIEAKSPSELHKIALQKNSDTISTGIRSLTEIERISIEYFEMTLQAEDIFKQLNSFEKELQELGKQLERVTPFEIPVPPRPGKTTQAELSTPVEPFEKELEVPEGKNLDSEALAAQLANRLNLTTSSSSDDDPTKWDGLPSRSPSPCGVLTLYMTQQQLPPAASPPSSSASIHTSDEKNRGFSHN